MDEKSFNDDVTIVGGAPARAASSSSGDFERTMNDDRTLGPSAAAASPYDGGTMNDDRTMVGGSAAALSRAKPGPIPSTTPSSLVLQAPTR